MPSDFSCEQKVLQVMRRFKNKIRPGIGEFIQATVTPCCPGRCDFICFCAKDVIVFVTNHNRGGKEFFIEGGCHSDFLQFDESLFDNACFLVEICLVFHFVRRIAADNHIKVRGKGKVFQYFMHQRPRLAGINSGAYVSEIFRAGIQAIDVGQMEAGRSLGLTWWQTMRFIILPQAFKNILPPLGNEFIAMLKDSSLVSVIGFEELTRRGQLIIAQTYGSFEIWMTVAVLYLIMTMAISRIVAFLEKR